MNGLAIGLVEAGGGATVTLTDLAPTRTTEVTDVGGAALPWRPVAGGLQVDLGAAAAGPADVPVVVRCVDVTAAGAPGT